MTSEHKIFLPDAPAPDAEARQAAITAALERFDEKNRGGHDWQRARQMRLSGEN